MPKSIRISLRFFHKAQGALDDREHFELKRAPLSPLDCDFCTDSCLAVIIFFGNGTDNTIMMIHIDIDIDKYAHTFI